MASWRGDVSRWRRVSCRFRSIIPLRVGAVYREEAGWEVVARTLISGVDPPAVCAMQHYSAG
jgi:hypothetical protein